MKRTRRKGVILSVAIFALVLAGTFGVRAQTGAPVDLSSYPLVASNAVPVFGNFYLVNNYGVTALPGLDAYGPPLPGDPRPDLPVYYLGSGRYMIDNSSDPNASGGSMAMGRGMMMGADFGSFSPMLSFDTNALWLDIAAITNGMVYADLNNATNQVYEILTKTDLSLTNWTIESEVWPTNPVDMPFTLYQNGRTNLFVWAMDWTGVTENGNTTPDWWFWEYFGTVDLSDTDLDTTGGGTLSFDYQHGRNPNVIQFSLVFTNINFSTNVVNGNINLVCGVPDYEAILINDTNTADAVWQPYSSTNLTVILPGNGTYDVEVGLKGFPPNATPIWQTISLTCLNPDTIPLVLVITNPASSTVSVPVIQSQGLVNKGLSNLVYDISNANGVITGQTGYWQPYFYDTNLLAFTTNAFQCYDIALATGLNTITLHATDVAGNTITTNISYSLDYSGDHTAPLLSVVWPPNGAVIAGSNVTVQAQIDDATATVLAVINGVTNQALVERNGTVWFNNLALAGGTNALTITATDAAGNMSQTNFDVVQSSLNFTINPLSGGQLNQTSITVTGTTGDSSDNVTINGVTAVVSGNSWTASNVPVSEIGTAALNAQVTDSGNNPLAVQTVYQPQPATIVVEAYEQTY
jgi:Glucodextranase, domain B